MDETEFAMELNKDYVNRMDPTMSLEEHYQGALKSNVRIMKISGQVESMR